MGIGETSAKEVGLTWPRDLATNEVLVHKIGIDIGMLISLPVPVPMSRTFYRKD